MRVASGDTQCGAVDARPGIAGIVALLLVAICILIGAIPARAHAALGPPPEKERATWWGADMGVIGVSQHVFTRPGNDRLTITGTVLNGGVGEPRWVWTDSGWAASGMYQAAIWGPGSTVSYSPAATGIMSVGYDSYYGWQWTAIESETCPVPYEGWHGQPDVPGTNRYASGRTFGATYDVSRTATNQWIRVRAYFKGNIGYLHWGSTASDYIAILSGDTHLAVTATPSRVPGDGETTSAVTATLTDDNGDAIPGETVRLSLSDLTYGTLSDAAPTTDASGVARSVFTPKYRAGTVTVTGEQDDESVEATIEVTPANQVKGTVVDGNGHALAEARVELFEGTDTVPRETVTTGYGGAYAFTPFVMDATKQYCAKVSLQDGDADPSNFRVLWAVAGGDAVYAKRFFTKANADANGAITRDFDFSNTAGMTLSPGVASADMNDIAAIYFHTKQAVDCWTLFFGVTLDEALPEDIVVGTAGTGAYHENPWAANHDIYIRANTAGYGSADRPVNREWHEFAHHAQFDMYTPPAASPWPFHPGDANHAGWANECSADSFVEGWAMYFPSVMKASHAFVVDPAAGSSSPWVYAFNGGAVDLELNQDYVNNRGAMTEEDVVARIMWDFTDSDDAYPSGPDDEAITVPFASLDAVLGQYRGNVKDVYDAFIALDDGVITDAQVNQVFLLQGAYYDVDGNGRHDDGEPIGQLADASRPLRQAKPPAAGTGIRLNLQTAAGGVVRDAVAMVDVDYEDDSLRDYGYEQPLETTTTPVLHLSMPATSTPATVSVRVKNTDDVTSSAVATVTSEEFWDAHQTWESTPESQTTDAIMQKDFIVEKAASGIRVTNLTPGAAASATYGYYVTVAGEVVPRHAGSTVRLYWRPVRSSRWYLLASTVTSAMGSFSMSARPGTRGTLQVRFLGDADHDASSRSITTYISHRVCFAPAVSSVRRGGRYYFKGWVKPGHYRRRVALQRRTSGGSWVTVAYATVNRYNRYTGIWRPWTRATYTLRVVLASDTYHTSGVSSSRTLRVR